MTNIGNSNGALWLIADSIFLFSRLFLKCQKPAFVRASSSVSPSNDNQYFSLKKISQEIFHNSYKTP